jgi:Fuc2NAc and GlcNAc transferase
MIARLVFVVLAACFSVVLTGLVRRYAIKRSLYDIPNARSSHTNPTPRGGGLAIVAVVLGGVLVGASRDWLSGNLSMALLGGALVALVGWIDDRRGVKPSVRAGIHFVAAAWAVYWLHADGVTSGHVVNYAIMVVVVAAAINFYNFMDGIDGLAATEAITASGAAAVLFWHAGYPSLGFVSLLVAAASAGFLYWNWSPARIFMGDVGSGFLGYVFGVLALATRHTASIPATIWLILLAVFIVDALLTLLRRVVRAERWYEAHKSHAYQRYVQAGYGHRQVTSSVLALNVVLIVLAAAAAEFPSLQVAALLAAGVVVVGAYLVVERLNPMT